jgi:probable HAF family extracellular repeat protein
VEGYDPIIIYDDLEQSDPTMKDPTDTSSCGDAAAAFVDGWVSAMTAELQPVTGVYAAPSDALAWRTNSYISHYPDNVWLTGANNNVTVWGLYPNNPSQFPDTIWPGTQRIHQYAINVSTTWGGTTPTNIDNDIEHATILANSSVRKTYTFTTQSVSYPGAEGTFPTGINNDINTAIGQYVGTITGTYRDPAYGERGFVYFNSALQIPFDCSNGDGYTQGNGLNDATFSNDGTVVGAYQDSSGWHGYMFDVASQTCTPLDITGARDTWPMGINDAQWVVGYYDESDGNTHGFLYRNGTFTTIDYPGGNTTMATGVDGLGRVIGQYCNDYWCDNQPSFIYDATTGNFSGPAIYPGADSYTDAYGINNNGQFSGQDGDYEGALDSYSFLADYYSATYWPLDQMAPALNSVVFGLNDNTEIVGGNEIGYLPGVVAIPQH